MENWHSRALGVGRKSSDDIVDYLHIKLAAAGCTLPQDTARQEFLEVAQDLIQNHLEKSRVLNKHLCPADRRIQDFIDKVSELAEDAEAPQLPGNTLVLDRHGLARELALPMGKDEHESSILNSHRLHQGVLHNPLHDRRTTKGSFHIADLGPLTPADKKLVPVCTFVGLLRAALTPSRRVAGSAVFPGFRPTIREFCVVVAAASGLSGSSRAHVAEIAGNPLLRTGFDGQQPRFRGVDFWQCW